MNKKARRNFNTSFKKKVALEALKELLTPYNEVPKTLILQKTGF